MLLDGNSLLHRAFYAIPMLSNKKGVYTNAVYGFTNMLLKLLTDHKPDYIAAAFDREAPTFRHAAYEAYKATRQKAPEALAPQFALIRRLLGALEMDIYELDGYEADDLLGTLARKAEAKGFSVLLVTGDKDALQLISEDTNVLITQKGISEVHRYDLKELEAVYGLTPPQIVDMKGLMGDSSDNIPGVPGIGQKTALKLLSEYPSVEAVLNHIEDISGKKVKENLLQYADQARLSKDLAAICTDAPIEACFPEDAYRLPKSPELKGLLEELEFHSLINKLDLSSLTSVRTETEAPKPGHVPSAVIEKQVVAIQDLAAVRDLAAALCKCPRVSICHGKTFSLYGGGSLVYSLTFIEDLLGGGLDPADALTILKPVFASAQIVTHDGKGLLRMLENYAIPLAHLAFDTLIAAYLLDPTQNKYAPEGLLFDAFGEDIAAADAMDIHRLSCHMQAQLKEYDMDVLYETVEHPLIRVLADMESAGFSVDQAVLKELDGELSREARRLTGAIHELAGSFNINSPKQLGEVLFDQLGLPAAKKTKTGYSTDIEVLEGLKGAHPVVEPIIEYRQVMKLKSTYIDGLSQVIDRRDGRIHTSFHQTVAATGRISSTEPNLQNIPVRLAMGRRIRKVFVPSSKDHVLVDADYSQIELRVLAHISEDPILIEAFLKNQDIHRRTAAEIFGVPMDQVTEAQRSSAKAVNFGIVYGISDFGLSRNLGISRAKAKQYIDSYLNRYSGVKAYMERIIRQGKEQGYVTTLLNRRRNLPELASRNFNIRSFGERLALNTPIQGTAADIIKLAMVAVHRELLNRGLSSRLILQVHDELIMDCLRSELEQVTALLKEQMEQAIRLSVPLVADIGVGETWYDAK